MSTKTTIKRIALVAAVAAAFGGLSTVAANATTATPVIDTTTANAPVWAVATAHTIGTGSASNTGTQVVGGFAKLTLTDTVTASSAGAVAIIGGVTSTGVGAITSASNGVTTYNTLQPTGTTSGSIVYPATSFGVVSANQTSAGATTTTVYVTSSVVGAQTLTFSTINADGSVGSSYTATITWVAAAAGVSNQYSTVKLYTGSTSTTAVTSVTASKALASNGATGVEAANIAVATFDSNNAALNTETVAATISGPGTLGASAAAAGQTTAASGRALSVAETAGVADFTVWSDGTAGTATITITDGTTTLGTATVNFYGAASKLTATQNDFVAAAGTALGATPTGALTNAAYASTPAVDLAVVDANGNPVSGATIKQVSSDSTVISTGTCVEGTGTTTGTAKGTYECSVSGATAATSGKTATVTFEILNSDGVTYTAAAPVTFAVGGTTEYSVSWAFDAATYSAGAPMVLTATVKDKYGNAVADNTTFNGVAASGNLAVQGTLPAVADTTSNGVATYKLYAPIISGTYTIKGEDSYALAAVSASAAITSPTDGQASAATDAANEATDAANAATDAANAAADAADAATAAAQDAGAKADAALAAVTALSAKITVLAAQIAKIVKKLGA